MLDHAPVRALCQAAPSKKKKAAADTSRGQRPAQAVLNSDAECAGQSGKDVFVHVAPCSQASSRGALWRVH